MGISRTLMRILKQASKDAVDAPGLSRQIQAESARYLAQYSRRVGKPKTVTPAPKRGKPVLTIWETDREREEREQEERDQELYLARQKESAAAAKSTQDFNEDIYKEAFKHRNTLEGKEIDLRNKKRLKVFERELTAEDRFRKNRNEEILNKFREARTGQIISEPLMKKYESELRTIEEGKKAQSRLAIEEFKQRNRIYLERFKQRDAIKLKAITEGLLRTRPDKTKKVKETTLQEYTRMKQSGAFRTVKDIARLGAEQKFKGDALKEITELRAAQFGIPHPVGGLITDAPLSDMQWKEWLNTELPEMDVDSAEAGRRISQGFGSKEAAERAILQLEAQAREEGVDEAAIQADVARMRLDVEKAYPDDPSNFDNMREQDERFKQVQENQRPSSIESMGNISEQIKNIYDDILSGVDERSSSGMDALKQIKGIISDIQSTEGDRVTEAEKRSRLRQQLGFSPKQEKDLSDIDKNTAATDFYEKKVQDTKDDSNLSSAKKAYQSILDRLRKKQKGKSGATGRY